MTGIAFGDPRLPERFWKRVLVNDSTGCWEWQGFLRAGYGMFAANDGERFKTVSTHRFLMQVIGVSVDGLDVDHLCRNTKCCNPAHLEAVTHRENMLRGVGATKTHCANGHEFTKENTRKSTSGKRECKTCLRTRSRDRKRRKLIEKPDLCRECSAQRAPGKTLCSVHLEAAHKRSAAHYAANKARAL